MLQGQWSAARVLSTFAARACHSLRAAEAAAAAVGGPLPVLPARPQPLPSLWQQYKVLSKLRLSALVTGTAAAGYALGSDEHLDQAGLAWTCLGTLGCAASANALNQLLEVARDARMLRTRGRPLPRGLMSRGHAMGFACATGVGGVTLLLTQCNALAAGLGAANIGLYVGVYTPLKVLWVGNTWVGAVVGAVPPLIGWAAARGELDLRGGWLAACVYFWQMPHFLSLAWLCREDYARGGYRMLSLRDRGGMRTAAAALRNSLYLVPTVAAAPLLGLTTPVFSGLGLLLCGYLARAGLAFRRSPCDASARRLFRGSLVQLPLLLAAMLVCRVPQTSESALDTAGLLAWLGWQADPADSREAGQSRERAQQRREHAAALQLTGPRMMPVPFPFLPLPVQQPPQEGRWAPKLC